MLYGLALIWFFSHACNHGWGASKSPPLKQGEQKIYRSSRNEAASLQVEHNKKPSIQGVPYKTLHQGQLYEQVRLILRDGVVKQGVYLGFHPTDSFPQGAWILKIEDRQEVVDPSQVDKIYGGNKDEQCAKEEEQLDKLALAQVAGERVDHFSDLKSGEHVVMVMRVTRKYYGGEFLRMEAGEEADNPYSIILRDALAQKIAWRDVLAVYQVDPITAELLMQQPVPVSPVATYQALIQLVINATAQQEGGFLDPRLTQTATLDELERLHQQLDQAGRSISGVPESLDKHIEQLRVYAQVLAHLEEAKKGIVAGKPFFQQELKGQYVEFRESYKDVELEAALGVLRYNEAQIKPLSNFFQQLLDLYKVHQDNEYIQRYLAASAPVWALLSMESAPSQPKKAQDAKKWVEAFIPAVEKFRRLEAVNVEGTKDMPPSLEEYAELVQLLTDGRF